MWLQGGNRLFGVSAMHVSLIVIIVHVASLFFANHSSLGI
jgi:hypothetical protein